MPYRFYYNTSRCLFMLFLKMEVTELPTRTERLCSLKLDLCQPSEILPVTVAKDFAEFGAAAFRTGVVPEALMDRKSEAIPGRRAWLCPPVFTV